MAQGGKDDGKDKENDKNKDKEDKEDNKDKNNKKDVTEFPSTEPTMAPSIATPSPSRYPTRSPTQFPTQLPTGLPTNSPTAEETFAVALPKIEINLVAVIDDIFLFAALLSDGNENDPNGIDSVEATNNRDALNRYFETFVKDLLIASDVVSSSTLETVELDIELLPLSDGETEGDLSLPAGRVEASNVTPIQIAIDGDMLYRIEDNDQEDDEANGSDRKKESGGTTAAATIDPSLLEEKMGHILAVYFSFWKTDEMIARLSEFGLTDPFITAVRVDDELVLVASEPEEAVGDNSGSSSDNDNRLVVPSAVSGNSTVGTIESVSKLTSGSSDHRSTNPFFTIVATAGSTILVLFCTILA